MIQQEPDLETRTMKFWVMKAEDVPADVATFSPTRIPGVVLVFAKRGQDDDEEIPIVD